jgi:hypothetical protein
MRSMSERPDPHAAEGWVGPHGQPDDHGGVDGHDDDAHGAEALGPIDVQAWGAAAIGLVLGLVVLLAFIQAVG